jgi:hypothetical protein
MLGMKKVKGDENVLPLQTNLIPVCKKGMFENGKSDLPNLLASFYSL